mmetsp:Transcript_39743/g.94203  ORF Transcript_39743/g.94203 Transcript_39743/m.94203 type:complete len:209 (-) Transcript_39743:249-875(-)
MLARLALDREQARGFGLGRILHQDLLFAQPARFLDLVDPHLGSHVPEVHLDDPRGRAVDIVAPRELPGLDAALLVHGAPHVVHARVDVARRAVLRVPRAHRARVVRPRVRPLVPLRAVALRHLTVVGRAVEVAPHVPGRLHVHRRHGCGAWRVHLLRLELPDLAYVGLVLVPEPLAFSGRDRCRLDGLLAPRVLDGPGARALHPTRHA